jgi:hypothetical protein
MLKNLNNEPSSIVSLLPLSQPLLLLSQPQQPPSSGSSESHKATTLVQENGNEISTTSTAADINIQKLSAFNIFRTAFDSI